MSTSPHGHDARHLGEDATAPIVYPMNQVLAVLDDEDALTAAYDELTRSGFLASEVHVACGPERADALRASTGRRGLAGLATRIADAIGVQDDEMAIKARYDQAMRDGKFVARVAAPTEERKTLASEILRRHGAHTISFHGRFTIEGLLPPDAA